MVLFKSFIKFIVNPIAIIVALIATIYIVAVFFKKGMGLMLEFLLEIISGLEEILGDSWLGKKYSAIIDDIISVFD